MEPTKGTQLVFRGSVEFSSQTSSSYQLEGRG